MIKKDSNIIWSIVHFNDLSIDQLFDILELRTEVFVVEQDCPYQEVDQKDKESFHVMAYANNMELIAVARILPAGISYEEVSFGRVAVKENYRGKGIAHVLNDRLISFIRSRLLSDKIRISAQSHLLSFYEKHGFKKVSEEYLEDDIPHIEMLLSPN